MSGAAYMPLRSPAAYWEARARRFAAEGQGLAAVCAYGMPGYYNHMIQLTQRLALAPWLKVCPGARVLDVGCGVGRWSRLLASRGAEVTGIDLSSTMIDIARRRVRDNGLAERCHFMVEDVARLDLGARYDLVLAVTVLQHILDPAHLEQAVRRLAAHLAEGGRAVLLEAAPLHSDHRCDSAAFTARQRRVYLDLFARCALRVRAVGGVDPARFKTWLLPYLRRMPRVLAWSALAAACAASLPIDVLWGRRAVAHSWHAVFVLESQ